MNERVSAIRKQLAERQRDQFLCLSPANLRYLTGFTGSNGAALITQTNAWFITDGRYREQAAKEVTALEVLVLKDIKLLEKVAELARESASTANSRPRISVEGDHLTVNQFNKLGDALAGAASCHGDSGMVEGLRIGKNAAEIASIRRAIQIAEDAFIALLPTLKEGESERDVKRRLVALMEERGAEKESFDSIVLFGARTSLPHGRAGETKLQRGDWILIDFGCFVDGYASDITRTFCFGKATTEMRERFDAVAEANRLSTATVRAGVAAKDVDAAGRAHLEARGHGERFEHGTGHGIGLEIHEAPRVAKTSEDVLAGGHVITIEPGIYFAGWGGIRIEDDVLVTPGGFEVLTTLPVEIEPLG